MRILVAVILLAAATTAAAGGTSVPVRTCAERIEAGHAPLRFPAPSPNRVLAGRLAFSGHFPRTPAGLGPQHENGRFATKVGALVRAGCTGRARGAPEPARAPLP